MVMTGALFQHFSEEIKNKKNNKRQQKNSFRSFFVLLTNIIKSCNLHLKVPKLKKEEAPRENGAQTLFSL